MRRYIFPGRTKTTREFFFGLSITDSMICSGPAIVTILLAYYFIDNITSMSKVALFIVGALGLVSIGITSLMVVLLMGDRALLHKVRNRLKFKKEMFVRKRQGGNNDVF